MRRRRTGPWPVPAGSVRAATQDEVARLPANELARAVGAWRTPKGKHLAAYELMTQLGADWPRLVALIEGAEPTADEADRLRTLLARLVAGRPGRDFAPRVLTDEERRERVRAALARVGVDLGAIG